VELEQAKTLDALQISIRMEIDGKEFYLHSARSSGNATGRELFQSLANEEDLHRKKFEEIYKQIQEQKGWPELKSPAFQNISLETVFSAAGRDASATATEIEALQTAMQMENRTYDFYHDRSLKAQHDAEKKVLRACSRTGKGPSCSFTGLLRILTKPGTVLHS
jgi:rubrerythrin